VVKEKLQEVTRAHAEGSPQKALKQETEKNILQNISLKEGKNN